MGKLKNLEKRILNLEKMCEKIENSRPNIENKTIARKTQNESGIQENWNTVVDEWLNGDNIKQQ